MLQAMMSAKVGDDVFGEDPSINELENLASDMFGMEAALFCPSAVSGGSLPSAGSKMSEVRKLNACAD